MDKLCEVLSDIMCEKVSEDYEFTSLDSLDRLELAIAVEDHYDISLTNVHTIANVKDLYERIQECS